MNMPRFNMTWIYILAFVVLGLLYFSSGGPTNSSIAKNTSYSDFKDMVNHGYASKIVINKSESVLKMYVKPEHIRDVFHQGTQQTGTDPYLEVEFGSVDQVEPFIEKAKEEKKFTGDLVYENQKDNGLFTTLLYNFLPILFIVGLWIFLMRRMGSGGMGGGGGVFNVGKSKAKMYEKGGELGITFKDVAGQAGAKQEIQEIVEFLKNPQKYTELGGKIPKGALLVGPPGTGKTLLAKAVAGEAGVPFFSMSGSDFVEMFVGVGASRVRDLFQQAKTKSPCIIFIDEIDAVGRARSKNPAMGGNDERENTLNALLTEMDGLKPVKIDDSVDIDFLARQTPGFSGADIANVCNEAALIAARHDSKSVKKQDFLDAVGRARSKNPAMGGNDERENTLNALLTEMDGCHPDQGGHARRDVLTAWRSCRRRPFHRQHLHWSHERPGACHQTSIRHDRLCRHERQATERLLLQQHRVPVPAPLFRDDSQDDGR